MTTTTKTTEELFLDDLCDNFYEQCSYRPIIPGQICWAPVLYIVENFFVWRPVKIDETGTTVRKFHIVSSRRDELFKRDVPLKIQNSCLNLETDEEFVVVKAKKRPVVVLSPIPNLVPQCEVVGAKGKVNKRLCIAVPLHSIEKYGRLKFKENFIRKVRKLEYPQFFFCPKRTNFLKKDSIARLDSLQPVFEPHMEPTDFKLSKEVLQILLGQLFFYFLNPSVSKNALGLNIDLDLTNNIDIKFIKNYLDIREELLNQN